MQKDIALQKDERCVKCNQVISDGVLALGKHYCASCFVCTKCRKPFSGSFVNVEGEPQHSTCVDKHIEVLSGKDKDKTCKGCNNAISSGGRLVTTDEGVFHVACFKCFACQKPIATGTEQGGYELWDGQVFCITCTPKPVCAGCDKQIETGKAIVLEQRTYHPDCLKRFACSQPFSGYRTNYSTLEGKLYHSECAEAQQGASSDQKCGICKRELTNPAVEVDGLGTLHKDCFKCEKCRKPFDEAFVKIHGKYYHEGCSE